MDVEHPDCEECLVPFLPPEMVCELLAKMDVPNLIRARLVSRMWNDLIWPFPPQASLAWPNEVKSLLSPAKRIANHLWKCAYYNTWPCYYDVKASSVVHEHDSDECWTILSVDRLEKTMISTS